MLTGKYDSVFTATKKHWVPHWDLKINPVGWNINNRPRRQERDDYLSWCDWTQGAASPLSDSKKAEWATFRQALRDLPTHSNWPDLEEDDWPTEPT